MQKILWFAVLLACAVPGLAQVPAADAAPDAVRAETEARVARNYHRRAAALIAEDGRARDLALAALLRDFADAGDGRPAGEDGAGPGAAAGGDDVLSQQLLLGGADDARRQRAAQRWAELEPDNLAPWLFVGWDAGGLQEAAYAARRFDLHMFESVRWIQSALLKHPPSEAERAVLFAEGESVEEFAAMTAIALWSAAALPPLQPLMEACSGRALRDGAQRTRCAALARMLASGSDTLFGEEAGLHLLGETAVDAAGRAGADAARRALAWRMSEWGRISAQQPRDGAGQFALLLQDSGIGSERQLVERVLRDAGVPAEPPADWSPPRR